MNGIGGGKGKREFFFVTPNFFRKEPSSSILSFTKILVCCSQGLSVLSRKQIKNDFPISITKMVLQPFDFSPYKYLKGIMTGRATVFPFFLFVISCAEKMRACASTY